MAKRIAIAGKGGTGKTTLTALLIQYLLARRPDKAILAVDADANANLNEALGLSIEETIGSILEDTKKPGAVPTGMTKDLFIEYRLNRALVETDHYDLLVMGNPQGPGCYCFPNDLLKRYLERLGNNYDYLLVDNEAGLEHLSRRLVPRADIFLITSDASARGVRSAGRVREIVENVKIEVGKMGLLITRSPGDLPEHLKREIDNTGLPLWGEIPHDPRVAELDLGGKPLIDIPGDCPAPAAACKIFNAIGL